MPSEPTLYREITDEERRTWSATRYTAISAVPVEPDYEATDVEPADVMDLVPHVTPEGVMTHTTWETDKSRGEAMLPPGRYALVQIGGDHGG